MIVRAGRKKREPPCGDPKLKFFGRYGFLEALRARDLVEKPVSASLVGDAFPAIAVPHVSTRRQMIGAAKVGSSGVGADSSTPIGRHTRPSPA
jgi:hypothetical protein